MIAALALAAPAEGAELCVRVRERGADGAPIPGAVVASGDATGLTGPDGLAVLAVPDGRWTVTVSAPGFVTTDASGARPEVTVWLKAGGPEELEVVVEGLRVTADPTRYAVDGEQATETPGTFEDAVRLVQSLPGVAVQREFAPSSGDLSIRGSTAGDNRYYLDGIEIPYLYHFNQYASVFPTSQIGSLEMYPSTFSSRYGDAVGAVVEARSHEEAPERPRGSVHGNLVTVGGDVATPVGGGGTWVSVAARRSYQDLAGESSPQYQIWPRFHDLVARVERGGVGLFVMSAGDRWSRTLGELDVLDPVEAAASPTVSFGQHFEGVGLRTRRAGPDGDELRTSVGVVRFVRDAVLAPRGDGDDLGAERFESVTASSRGDALLRFGDQGLDAGWELLARDARYAVDEAPPAAVRAYREAPGLARGAAVDARLLRLQAAGYATARFAFGDLALAPGVRAGGDTCCAGAGAGPLVDPRLGARLPLSDGFMLKAAAGRYSQRPDPELALTVPDLPTTRATQASIGFESAIAGRMEIGLDAYAKDLAAPIVVPVDALPYAADRGSALGAELVTRYRIREVVFLWGWLGVQRARFTLPGGEVAPAPGDQRVAGGLVLSIDTGGWNLGARYRGASGLPFTPLEGSVYDAGVDQWVAIPGPTNGARLPAYHKVDLHVAHTWELRGWSFALTGELWLVPRSAAALYPTWSYDYSEQGFVRGPTALPLVGARAEF